VAKSGKKSGKTRRPRTPPARTQPTRPASSPVTSAHLLRGWPPTPAGYRVRLGRPGDLTAAADLVALTEATFDEEVQQAVAAGTIGTGLVTGLDRGVSALLYELATHTTGGTLSQYLTTLSALLVAHDPDENVVAALLVTPPVGVLAQAVEGGLDRMRSLMTVVTAAKIKAVAVAEPARGHDLGGELLRRGAQTYRQVRYHYLYGQLAAGTGLETYYQRRGFEVLPAGEGLDLEPLLDLPLKIHTDRTERIFVRNLRHRPA
jgi:GNAT superfamily N-acetyltransferase